MYGFQADFVHEGNIRMILTREPAIHSDELDSHQVNMLQYNEIPHLLLVELREVDFEVALLYDISGKKMLEQVLRSVQMNAIQYFEWMFQLVNILEGCRAYMLHPNQILLHERFIYVDGHSWNGNLYTAYVPIVEPLHPQAGIEGLKRLGILLSSYVVHWNGDGFQRLVQLLSQEGATLADVRGLLQSFIGGSPTGFTVDSGSGESKRSTIFGQSGSYVNMEQESSGWNMGSITCSAEAGRALASVGSLSSKNKVTKTDVGRSCHMSLTDMDEEDKPSSKKYTITISGAVVFAAVLGWKYGYISHKTAETFIYSLIWSIFAIAVGAICLTGLPSIWWERLYSGETNKLVESDGRAAQSRPGLNWQAADRVPDLLPVELSHLSHPAEMSIEDGSENIQISSDGIGQASSTLSRNEYYTELTHRTMILDAPGTDATVILTGDGQQEEEGKRQEPYLQRLDEAGIIVVATFPLHISPFIIGRAEQGVHYRDRCIGVSKHHCELVRTSMGEYEIQDLGSRNGTELQGELIIPYKRYPLRDGDKLSIARSQYIFRAG